MSSIWAAAGEAAKYRLSRPEHPAAIVEAVVAFLREGYTGAALSQALDVGCGSGLSTKNLVPHFPRVLGVDVSSAMVEEARSSHPLAGLEFATGSADHLPLPDASVQVVMAGRAIHYFNQEQFFQEVHRVLAPGGVVAYYSVHFPTVLHEGVNSLWWSILDSDQLKPFWPVNPGDGHIIGARNRRDYYIHTIQAPYTETRVDESVSYDRPLALSTLAAELDTYSAVVRHRQSLGEGAAPSLASTFLSSAMAALDTSDPDIEVITRNSFFIVMAKKPMESAEV